MNSSDKNNFAALMAALAENFNAELSKPGLRLRFEALRGFSLAQIEQAALSVMSNRKYAGMPPVAELIEAIQGKPVDEKLLLEDKAEVEAGKIIDHLNKFGAGTWPDLSDPITKVLMTTRWPYPSWASQVTTSESVWWKKEFKNAYKSISRVDGRVQVEAPKKVLQLVQKIGGE